MKSSTSNKVRSPGRRRFVGGPGVGGRRGDRHALTAGRLRREARAAELVLSQHADERTRAEQKEKAAATALTAARKAVEIAKRLEEIALSDEYFIEKKLYPNVDFYSGIIYKAMGFPPQMFTVLFAMGRLPGWIAQWREMIEDPATRIGRPRQVYVGRTERNLPRAMPLPRH